MFGLLMHDNTPVDRRYLPRRALGRRFGIPPGVAARVPQYGNLRNVPGTPYGRARFAGARFASFGGDDVSAVPGVPETFGEHLPNVPGVPSTFGRFGRRSFARFGDENPTMCFDADGNLVDCPMDMNANLQVDPSDPTYVPPSTDSTSGWTGVVKGVLDLATGVLKATSSGQTYTQGSCPVGYVNAGGRCVPVQGRSSSSTGTIVAIGLGLAAVMFLRKRT